MNRHLHANAMTTPKIRAYIQPSTASHLGLARELGGSVDSILRWHKRADVYDASHTPHRLQTTPTPAQEAVTVELRCTLLLSLNDLLGFVHIDIKCMPQMPDKTAHRYLFVAIDRATRWVYLRIYTNQSESSSTHFLRWVKRAAPLKILDIFADNGSQFTDDSTSRHKIPSGHHAFDRECALLGIEHRLIPPRRCDS